ncbi:MAG TPA: DUF2062 domain-containing protein [Candidatus Dormibacteraeota bacterium]|nr:DUF2062 domain-containing protein [Candidatus Dormibacteraeota bacterium]
MARTALKQRLRETWHKLSHLNASPDQIATGFSIGIFAGLLPLNPSPTITAIVLAWLLKRNVVAAIAGAVTSILYIPLLPFIWLAEYRLGKLILPVQHPLRLDQTRLWDVLQHGRDVYFAMLVGSIIIAAPVILLTYLVVKRLAQRWARQKNGPQHSAQHPE